MRRSVAFVGAFLSILMTFAVSLTGVSAQSATPADFSVFPQLNVTVTDSALTLDTSTIPSGYVSINLINKSSSEVGVGVVGPAKGETMAQLQQEAATPAAGDGFPPFLYKAVVAGGPSAIQPGETGSQVVHVAAGDWAVFSEGNQAPAMLTVADSDKSVTTAPSASATITLSNFLFAGLDGLVAGSQTVAVTNTGDQPHMMELSKAPDGTTIDSVKAAMQQDDTGTPVAGAVDESQLKDMPSVILLSTGETSYLTLNLEPGTYLAMCFVTDPASGKVHAEMGMASVFVVGGEGTPTT